MYFNVLSKKVSRSGYKEMFTAAKNRGELISAGLTGKHDLINMGLLSEKCSGS